MANLHPVPKTRVGVFRGFLKLGSFERLIPDLIAEKEEVEIAAKVIAIVLRLHFQRGFSRKKISDYLADHFDDQRWQRNEHQVRHIVDSFCALPKEETTEATG